MMIYLVLFFHGSRRWSLERKLADADVTEEEQNNILKSLEKKETEYMRLQRHKMGVDDFELLTIIGRGAFGEVVFYCPPMLFQFYGIASNLKLFYWFSWLRTFTYFVY